VHWLQAYAIHLGHVLGRYGGGGLFLINVLDSSILAFPLINDVLLMHMASRNPSMGLVYALYCTLGSLAGSFAIYGLGRGGNRLLRRSGEMREAGRARRWLKRNDFVTVLVASLLPPPTPFKVVPVVAGAVRMKVPRLASALIVGRGVRFLVEAWIGIRYGKEAENYLRTHLVFLSVITVASVLILALAYRYLQETAPQDTSAVS
jgi:membrane protein YqaA with SNARE-associated domain